jgi:hypothetical protein
MKLFLARPESMMGGTLYGTVVGKDEDGIRDMQSRLSDSMEGFPHTPGCFPHRRLAQVNRLAVCIKNRHHIFREKEEKHGRKSRHYDWLFAKE